MFKKPSQEELTKKNGNGDYPTRGINVGTFKEFKIDPKNPNNSTFTFTIKGKDQWMYMGFDPEWIKKNNKKIEDESSKVSVFVGKIITSLFSEKVLNNFFKTDYSNFGSLLKALQSLFRKGAASLKDKKFFILLGTNKEGYASLPNFKIAGDFIFPFVEGTVVEEATAEGGLIWKVGDEVITTQNKWWVDNNKLRKTDKSASADNGADSYDFEESEQTTTTAASDDDDDDFDFED